MGRSMQGIIFRMRVPIGSLVLIKGSNMQWIHPEHVILANKQHSNHKMRPQNEQSKVAHKYATLLSFCLHLILLSLTFGLLTWHSTIFFCLLSSSIFYLSFSCDLHPSLSFCHLFLLLFDVEKCSSLELK